MKTIEEFIKEIESSDAFKSELRAIKDKDALADFLKKYDVSGTAEEFAEAFKAKYEAEGEIGDNDAEAAAGGARAQDLSYRMFQSAGGNDGTSTGHPHKLR